MHFVAKPHPAHLVTDNFGHVKFLKVDSVEVMLDLGLMVHVEILLNTLQFVALSHLDRYQIAV
jgi:hypothetical protein